MIDITLPDGSSGTTAYTVSVNTRHLYNICTMSDQRRRGSSVKPSVAAVFTRLLCLLELPEDTGCPGLTIIKS